jgi:polyhydroxyalkanoate synthesis regulator phasin
MIKMNEKIIEILEKVRNGELSAEEARELLGEMGYRQPGTGEDRETPHKSEEKAGKSAPSDGEDIWARLGSGLESLGRRIDQGIRNTIDSIQEETVIDGDVDYDVPASLKAHVKGSVNGDIGKSPQDARSGLGF